VATANFDDDEEASNVEVEKEVRKKAVLQFVEGHSRLKTRDDGGG
jgi:hypothetical protein